MGFSVISLKRLSALLVVIILLVGTVSTLTAFAATDDDKNKKPQTLAQICSKLDDKDAFKSLVCVAILNISNSIQSLQDQITHVRLVQFPQTCPTGQVMVGIDNQGKIICEISTSSSQTSAIVTLSQTLVQVDPNIPANAPPQVSLTVTAIVLTPNTGVTVYLNGTQVGTGLSNSAGGFSFTIPITSAFPVGNYFVQVTDQNGRTGSDKFTVTLPPPPKPHATVTLNPTSGHAGTSVSLTATGLTPNASVTIYVNGAPFGTQTADGSGVLSLSVPIPPATPMGTYTVSVDDHNGVTGSATFTVN